MALGTETQFLAGKGCGLGKKRRELRAIFLTPRFGVLGFLDNFSVCFCPDRLSCLELINLCGPGTVKAERRRPDGKKGSATEEREMRV